MDLINPLDSIPHDDPNRSSVEIALDLIYRYNQFDQFRIHASKIKFGIPRAIDLRPDILTDENTFVPADVDTGFDFRFAGVDEGFFYRRIPLSLLTPDPNVLLVTDGSALSTHEILSNINAKFHTQFTKHDIIDTPYPAGTTTLTIHADPRSLVWLGQVSVTLETDTALMRNSRLLEDGSERITENDVVRILESIFV